MSATAVASPYTSCRITREDIRCYQRDGAVLLKSVLRGAALAGLAQALDEVRADPTGRFTRVTSPDGTGQTVVAQCASADNPVLASLISEGGIARIAAQLMEVASAQQILDQMFYKEPGRIVPTPWHQDTPFLCVRGMEMARVWISCDASPPAATVQVVRGSHRWNVVYDTRSEARSDVAMTAEKSRFLYEGIGDARLPPSPDVERYRDSFDILSWDVEPGDAIVFQGNVLHGTQGLDHHPHPRRAFATMWGGPDLTYHQAPGFAMPTPRPGGGVEMRHGQRIGDYPEVFPIYWTQQG